MTESAMSTVDVVVDDTKCVGHACCVIAAPDVFDLPGNSTVAQVLVAPLTADRSDLVAQAEEAEAECPMAAITLTRR